MSSRNASLEALKRYLIAGLLVWIPLGITIWVLQILLSLLDQSLLLVPPSLRPEALFGFKIPGLGALLSFAILLLTGVIAANFFGARLIAIWESILGRIPVVKSIYSSVKQVSDTLLSDSGNAFRKALLVEYPYQGCWTIAFQTGIPAVEVAGRLSAEHVSVYVPTTPVRSRIAKLKSAPSPGILKPNSASGRRLGGTSSRLWSSSDRSICSTQIVMPSGIQTSNPAIR